jgi:hypothetical protein
MFLLIFFAMLPRLPPPGLWCCPAVVLAVFAAKRPVDLRLVAAQDAFLIISQNFSPLHAKRGKSNISSTGPLNRRSLGYARDDKGKGDASIEIR